MNEKRGEGGRGKRAEDGVLLLGGGGVDARVRNYGLADKIKEIPHYRIACYVLQFIA